ncbi:hypothetical protein BpHYR1_005050 [Brachionus plicatilis]|uniref:Uncharacterized protein n=1 Tax=Brachionus plicatilis TaxID=10195 RepID=A0A3M7P7U4_BRAPC|nr:hypothetical protein BpHYR1_005050 [Brachionus plicatilis]
MNGLKTKKPKSSSTELKAVELDETINDADSNEDDNDLKYIDRQEAKKQYNNSDENFTFITEPNYQAQRSSENMLKLPSIVL